MSKSRMLQRSAMRFLKTFSLALNHEEPAGLNFTSIIPQIHSRLRSLAGQLANNSFRLSATHSSSRTNTCVSRPLYQAIQTFTVSASTPRHFVLTQPRTEQERHVLFGAATPMAFPLGPTSTQTTQCISSIGQLALMAFSFSIRTVWTLS